MLATSCDIDTAAAIIKDGGVIAYPTEAVFGLGCDPNNTPALKRLLAIKRRADDKGLILIASSLEQLEPYLAAVSDDAKALMNKHWPGPVTLVVSALATLDPLLTGNRDTLAVRVSQHPTVCDLCKACGHALVSTSANISGQTALKTPSAVIAQLGADIDAVVAGELGTLDRPTKIIDARSGDVLRH